jgi:hypothetical protein
LSALTSTIRDLGGCAPMSATVRNPKIPALPGPYPGGATHAGNNDCPDAASEKPKVSTMYNCLKSHPLPNIGQHTASGYNQEGSFLTSRDGGTGRRSGLKIRRGQPHGGSIPPPGTNKINKLQNQRIFGCVFLCPYYDQGSFLQFGNRNSQSVKL